MYCNGSIFNETDFIYQDDIVYGQLHMLCPENFDIKVRCSQIKIDLKEFEFQIVTSKRLRPLFVALA